MLFSYVPFGVTVMVLGCPDYLQVLSEVPVPVPARGVRVFAGVHIVGPWGYPDLYPPAGTRGFCGNAGPVQNQSKPGSNSKLDQKFGLGSATPWN
jgi:hypothetical protein